jgi:hypothetical protein
MKLAKEEVVEWRMVSEGMKNLVLIFYFNQIQEKNLQERFHKIGMELGNVSYWIHEYSQILENSQRYGDENVM